MTGSTFGCISGVARYLKEKKSSIKVTLVEPEFSQIYKYHQNSQSGQQLEERLRSSIGASVIEGAGKDKPTKCLDLSLIDDVVKVSDSSAIEM